MSLQEDFKDFFDALPEPQPAPLTFMEIAGFPHYENVCSNILKFFFTQNSALNELNGILLQAFFEEIGKEYLLEEKEQNITVKREVTTDEGRIDIVLFTNKWVLAIENKIFHWLHNDLQEYADFIKREHKNKEQLKVVLSIKNEHNSLKGGFINITYDQLIKRLITKLKELEIDKTSEYYIIFLQFLQTIKKLSMPIEINEAELNFLLKNEEKIEQIIQLKNKLTNYINQRACKIKDAIHFDHLVNKWVYEGYDVGFHYKYNDVLYKLECPIYTDGISIVICVEINTVNWAELNKLDLFNSEEYKYKLKEHPKDKRVIIEEGIPFSIDDNELIEKLKKILHLFKVTEI